MIETERSLSRFVICLPVILKADKKIIKDFLIQDIL